MYTQINPDGRRPRLHDQPFFATCTPLIRIPVGNRASSCVWIVFYCVCIFFLFFMPPTRKTDHVPGNDAYIFCRRRRHHRTSIRVNVLSNVSRTRHNNGPTDYSAEFTKYSFPNYSDNDYLFFYSCTV